MTLGGVGHGKAGEKRHPTIMDGAMIGSGAQVLGDITIGRGAKVGANSVVISDVPECATAIGIPARIVKCKSDDSAYGLPPHEVLETLSQQIDTLLSDVDTIKEQLAARAKNDKAA